MALLLRRAAGVAGLIAAAFLVVFVLVRVLPGDPVARLVVQPGVGAAELAAIRAELGLDRPVAVQLGAYLGAMARGDLGRSLVTGRPVSAENDFNFKSCMQCRVYRMKLHAVWFIKFDQASFNIALTATDLKAAIPT